MFPITRAKESNSAFWNLNPIPTEKGTYTGSKNIGSAFMSCPKCGQAHMIANKPGQYKIEPNGQVFPSIICSNDDCNFHEHIKLKDWNNEN